MTVQATIAVMIAAELYGSGCPVVLVEADAWSAMTLSLAWPMKVERCNLG